MRCQHAKSNPPWILHTVHFTVISKQLATINLLKLHLKRSKYSLSLCFCGSASPPSFFPLVFILLFSLFFSYHPSIHPFFLCFCIMVAVLHSDLIHRGPGGEPKQVLDTTANPLIHPPLAYRRAWLCHSPAFMCHVFMCTFLVFKWTHLPCESICQVSHESHMLNVRALRWCLVQAACFQLQNLTKDKSIWKH